MKTTAKTLDTLVEFLEARKEAHKNYLKSMDYNWDEPVTMKIGQKYAKLVTGTGVTAFIDLMSGDIYKPAGWAKPANHVRGNIFNNLGEDAFDSSGFVKYLR
ncbi:MAG TPA: hypothetical protein VMR18_01735 [Candidatus Saccharimonadales bacterium]|nr:hypothetical protein [Candidatus Saccharimonadales bacterium]